MQVSLRWNPQAKKWVRLQDSGSPLQMRQSSQGDRDSQCPPSWAAVCTHVRAWGGVGGASTPKSVQMGSGHT